MVIEGAGAFVCGEETALMAGIEGRAGATRASPSARRPTGLWGKPTNVNNVETYANVPQIIQPAPSGFLAIGTDRQRAPRSSP